MNLQSIPTASAAAMPALSLGQPFSADDVVLSHLRTPAEIASVLHLREEIDLSVHAAAGPQFATLEKKETSAVSSMPSTCTASASERSASFRWATG